MRDGFVSIPLVGGRVALPVIETPGVPLETPGMEIEMPAVLTETRATRPIVPWLGRVEPHVCPRCGTRILRDQSTKACIVSATKPETWTATGRYQDRDMKCLACGGTFVARENFT